MEKFCEFSKLEIEEVFNRLNSSINGLSDKEAEERLKNFGFNEIKGFKVEALQILKRNLLNYFNLFLLVASILSLIIEGLDVETILIFAFFVIAVSISFYQDYKASKLVEKLLQFFKTYVKVKRNGEYKIIDKKYLVPGDYVRVENGNLIPADLRIVNSQNLLVDESSLTGESEPVYKVSDKIEDVKDVYSAKNIAFNGTIVKQGFLEGIVFATGKDSYFGKISKTTLEIYKETAYQKTLNKFTKFIAHISLLLAGLIIILNYLKPEPLNFSELTMFLIVLIISIVPEFLPGITVLTLTISAFKLAKSGVIVKRLSAIEDLGGIQVLCVDKTGTITKNILEFKKIISDDEDRFLKYFFIDYFLAKEISPYTKALLESKKIDLEKIKESIKDIKLIEEMPFDPIKRIKITKIIENGEMIEIIKGAPENIIEKLKDNKEKYLEEFKKLSIEGLRTISLCILKDNNFEYLGILGFEDPLKETAKKAIKKAERLGIKIKILTGDAKEVAKRVGIELGLCQKDDKIILGEDIKKMSEEELKEVVEKNNIFARVLPEDKYRIIKILQEKYFVGFLGEGINDAEALKIADVSLVVDNAADIAKQEADILLKEKDLNLIVASTYEGRKDFYNLGKYLKHTMSGNFGNFFVISFLTLFLKYIPLLPIQILLTNLITDLPLGPIGVDNVNDEDIKKPVSISSYTFIFLLIILGFVAAIVNLSTFLLVKNLQPDYVRTALFTITTLTGIFVMFSIRTKKSIIFNPKMPPVLLLTFILAIFLTILFITHPFFMKLFQFVYLPTRFYLYISILLFIFILFTELAKKVIYKIFPDTI
ncbi:MAG: cation-translocating P-type ATPase [Minisyncoccia bacterium]